MFTSKTVRKTAVLVVTLILTGLTMAVSAHSTQAQTNSEIVRKLRTGIQFACYSEISSHADTILEITHGGIRSNVTNPAYTFGRQTITIPFTGRYYARTTGAPKNSNVEGVITIVRWSTGVALKISFTVNPGLIVRPEGKKLVTDAVKFEGAIRLSASDALGALMAGTFTINSPTVIDVFRSEEPKPGPFPFWGRQIL